MKTFFIGSLVALVVLLFTGGTVSAQDEVNRFEVFAGYAYMNLNRGIDPDEFDDDLSDFPANRVNAHGFNASATYNFNRFIGAKFDMTFHGHSQDFDQIPFKLEQKVNQYMGGIQIKDNRSDGPKFKPFAHFLAGAASQSIQLELTGTDDEIVPFDVNSTDFAMKLGAGIDYKVHKNIDIRLIQFDWNPIFRSDTNFGPTLGTLPGVMQNNLQLTFGVVFH